MGGTGATAEMWCGAQVIGWLSLDGNQQQGSICE